MPEFNAESEPIVRVRDLRKVYKSGWFGSRKLEALRGVSLEVPRGEIFGLLGPNGAGKTTLIKTLLGVIRKSSGSATLFGQPVGLAASRNRIGYVPENLRVEKHHTARTALYLYGQLSRMPVATMRTRADELLGKVGLAGRDKESVRRFSKGMYQRLGLAQALMHDPDLLILDEPTDGLDPVGRLDIRNLLRQLREEGKTIFLNSHIMHEVEAVCDRVAIMAKGKLRGIGRIEELTTGREQRPFRMEVLGDAETALAGLPESLRGSATTETIPVDGGEGCRLTVSCTADDQIDACVDGLRQAGVSIRKLQRDSQSLEDTFISLLNENEPVEEAV